MGVGRGVGIEGRTDAESVAARRKEEGVKRKKTVPLTIQTGD
jgi:hypothetical protein